MPSSYKTTWEKNNRHNYNETYRTNHSKVGTKITVKKIETTERHRNTILSIEPTDMNFKGSDREEPECCNEFGCGRLLNSQEKLFGNKCINHQTKKKIDINQVLSYPLKKCS